MSDVYNKHSMIIDYYILPISLMFIFELYGP